MKHCRITTVAMIPATLIFLSSGFPGLPPSSATGFGSAWDMIFGARSRVAARTDSGLAQNIRRQRKASFETSAWQTQRAEFVGCTDPESAGRNWPAFLHQFRPSG